MSNLKPELVWSWNAFTLALREVVDALIITFRAAPNRRAAQYV